MLRNPAHGRKLSLSHCCLGLTIGVSLLALTGCAERTARAFPWATAVLVHPRLPTQVVPTLDGEPPPDLRPSIPETPLRLIAHSVPPRPRETSRGSQPVLVPQLSPEDMSEAKQQTQDSLAVAERNLGSTKGRKLTPAQSDLVAKIRSFIEQAKGAVGSGDWARARTLAEKAQVLSEDLVRSL